MPPRLGNLKSSSDSSNPSSPQVRRVPSAERQDVDVSGTRDQHETGVESESADVGALAAHFATTQFGNRVPNKTKMRLGPGRPQRKSSHSAGGVGDKKGKDPRPAISTSTVGGSSSSRTARRSGSGVNQRRDETFGMFSSRGPRRSGPALLHHVQERIAALEEAEQRQQAGQAASAPGATTATASTRRCGSDARSEDKSPGPSGPASGRRK